jgi:hypothetical protein
VAVGPGDVTRTQMRAQVRAIFDRADLDKDDFMSREEFAGRMEAVMNRRPPGSAAAPSKEEAQKILDAAFAAFKAVDTDGDGKLSRVEASRRPLAAFDMMDANKDGVLTVAEKVAARGAPEAAVAVPAGAAAGAEAGCGFGGGGSGCGGKSAIAIPPGSPTPFMSSGVRACRERSRDTGAVRGFSTGASRQARCCSNQTDEDGERPAPSALPLASSRSSSARR